MEDEARQGLQYHTDIDYILRQPFWKKILKKEIVHISEGP